jgi:hypothetical protein
MWFALALEDLSPPMLEEEAPSSAEAQEKPKALPFLLILGVFESISVEARNAERAAQVKRKKEAVFALKRVLPFQKHIFMRDAASTHPAIPADSHVTRITERTCAMLQDSADIHFHTAEPRNEGNEGDCSVHRLGCRGDFRFRAEPRHGGRA